MKQIYNFSVIEAISPNNFWQNRAFEYGDGLFETIIFRQGTARFLEDHYERLTSGMKVLDIAAPDRFSFSYLQKAIEALVKQNELGENARVKVQVWRRPGGLYTPVSQEAEFLLTASPLADNTPVVKEKVVFYEDYRLHQSPVSRFKTTSALPYVLAGLARKRAGADDVILLDVLDHVAECLASNIFWLKGPTLFTPSLASGCIEGVMRKQIIRRASQYGLIVEQGLFGKEELLAADTVFCCNVAGIQWIRRIESRSFQSESDNPMLQQLLAALR